MIRRPPRYKRTDTLFPYTMLFRSPGGEERPGLSHRRRHGSVRSWLVPGSVPSRSERYRPVCTAFPHLGLLRNFGPGDRGRSEEHTSELQSLMRISYAVFCLKKKLTQPTIYLILLTNKYKEQS